MCARRRRTDGRAEEKIRVIVVMCGRANEREQKKNRTVIIYYDQCIYAFNKKTIKYAQKSYIYIICNSNV